MATACGWEPSEGLQAPEELGWGGCQLGNSSTAGLVPDSFSVFSGVTSIPICKVPLACQCGNRRTGPFTQRWSAERPGPGVGCSAPCELGVAPVLLSGLWAQRGTPRTHGVGKAHASLTHTWRPVDLCFWKGRPHTFPIGARRGPPSI